MSIVRIENRNKLNGQNSQNINNSKNYRNRSNPRKQRERESENSRPARKENTKIIRRGTTEHNIPEQKYRNFKNQKSSKLDQRPTNSINQGISPYQSTLSAIPLGLIGNERGKQKQETNKSGRIPTILQPLDKSKYNPSQQRLNNTHAHQRIRAHASNSAALRPSSHIPPLRSKESYRNYFQSPTPPRSRLNFL